MIKLVYGIKNKIIKPQKRNFQQLRELIKTNFSDVPADYSLSYLDQDKDEICLNSDEDLNNMFNTKLKTYKVYIKQSLSQTIILDIDRSQSIDIFEQSNIEEKPQESAPPNILDSFKKESRVQILDIPQEEALQKIAQSLQIAQPKQIQIAQPKSIQIAQVKGAIQAKEIVLEQNVVQKQQVAQIHQVAEQKKQEVFKLPKPQFQQEKPQQFKEVIKQQAQIEQIYKVQPIKLPIRIQPSRLKYSSDKQHNSKVDPNQNSQKRPPYPKEEQNPLLKAKIFQKRQIPRQLHKKQSQVLQVHNIICSNCKDEFGILGIRYQCIICTHYNLCSNCESQTDHEHSLLKVRTAKKSLSRDTLIELYRAQIYVPVQHPAIPAGNYLPSINKEDAYRIIEAAKQAYTTGITRSENLIKDLFYKLEMSHKNPYEQMKPAPVKVEPMPEKAQYLSELVGISYNEAFRFCNTYPTLDREKTTEIYFRIKKI